MLLEKRTRVKNSIGRMLFAALAILLQIAWFLALFYVISMVSAMVNIVLQFIGTLVVLKLYGRNEIASFKLPWIILILGFPILGISIYLLFGNKRLPRKIRHHFEKTDLAHRETLTQDLSLWEELQKKDPYVANQCRYIAKKGGYPVYHAGDVTFYPQASEGFEAQLSDLEKAEKYIFMEYHAIEEAASFERLRNILAKKAAQGLDIRILYDDVGSLGFIDTGFIKRMRQIGVSCRVFNPVMPLVNLFMNNRDHRKITVIDGKIGYTGGYNLADEYFNITHPYGHWKDTGVRLTGDAVRSLTALFFELWNAMGDTGEDFSAFLPPAENTPKNGGYVQPFGDRPMDDEPLSENVYLNLIKSATKRLYIATPYLIISDEMNRELCLTAGRGVDVRILTPGIPDKKLIYRVTRSYYPHLVRGGVRIFEYTPGFCHEKQVLCDDTTALVGTINLDYRSLYHHFENGVLLHRVGAIASIAEDFEKTFALSQEVTQRYEKKGKNSLRLGQCVLRLFAPLL